MKGHKKRDGKFQREKDRRAAGKYSESIRNFRFSPEDKRDWKIGDVVRAAPPLPEEYRTEGNVPVMNQMAVGSCVPHAIAAALGYGEFKTGFTDYNDYSRGFIYGNRAEGDFKGEGMVTREAVSRVNKDGDCLYNTFPWNESYPKVSNRIGQNKAAYFEEAAVYKILNYVRCFETDEIKQAIYSLGAVVCAFDLYSGFGRNVELPKPDEKSQGGHAVCLVGWDKTGWIAQNSWSMFFGDKGYCYIPYEYPVREVWGITVNGDVPRPSEKSFMRKMLDFAGRVISGIARSIGVFFYNIYIFIISLFK